jgi:acetyl esterase/lipase
MLVTLRDQGIPLPAGAILISPWVDLTHSFPSVAAECPFDYIPAHGFHQRPSAAWPPPNSDDMLAIEEGIVKKMAAKDHKLYPNEKEEDAVQGFHVHEHTKQDTRNANADTTELSSQPTANNVPGSGGNLSIMLDGKLVEIKDQIQMYASNHLISHPLVSPILQPSLGGLPPLLILTGGGEMLADEQIYLAHKAANPSKYPPGDAFLDEHPSDHAREQITKWKPTDVQLQVWDDMCHVGVTLSFTRPAKHMYRSVAQFGAWALARAQKTEIEILDDDDISIISRSSTDSESDLEATKSDLVSTAALLYVFMVLISCRRQPQRNKQQAKSVEQAILFHHSRTT